MAFEFQNAEHYINICKKHFRNNYGLELSPWQQSKLQQFYEYCMQYRRPQCLREFTLHLYNGLPPIYKNLYYTRDMVNAEVRNFCLDNGNSGLYFFLDEDFEYVYIGKSVNLTSRVYSSYLEKSKKYQIRFVKFMFMEPHYAHICEPYCVLKYKPKANVDFVVDYEYELADINYPLIFSNAMEMSITEEVFPFEWEDFAEQFLEVDREI